MTQKRDIFCGDGCSGIWGKEVNCFCDLFNYCVIVWLQKWKDDLNINNYFSLVYNELELLMLHKKEEVNQSNDRFLQGVTILQ